MKTLLVGLTLFALPLMAAETKATKVPGYISDAMCGAKHTSANPNEACVKKCIDGGSKPVFVDDAKNEVYAIDDPDAVKGHYGHHVAVSGKIDDSSKTIHITKVAMM